MSAARHMPDRISVRAVAIGASAVAAGIVFSIVVGLVVLQIGGHRGTEVMRATHSVPPPIAGPIALQPSPELDIAAYRAEKQKLLGEYAWVDRDHGIVRIPIEQAMTLLAARGAAEKPQ